MNYTKLKKVGLLVAAMLMTTSLHAYNEMNAIRDCAVKLGQGGEYNNMSNQKAVNLGHTSYTVTGNVKAIRNNSTHKFTCNIRHKEIINLNVNDKHHKNNSYQTSAMGVGTLGLHKYSSSQNDRYNNHSTGGDPFDDMKYIKRQCRKNIHHYINRDHGSVEKIRFESAYLHNRKLTGRGYVVFKRGGERDLNYSCDFDRRGEIYDGHYGYTRRR
jgi:hypothetical protein